MGRTMSHTFTLTIELGNDAMQTGADVAEALRRLAHRLEDDDAYGELKPTSQRIKDRNGNTVGQFTVTE